LHDTVFRVVLDVAVTCFRSRRLNAKRDKFVLRGSLLHGHTDHVKEFGLFQDKVVGWANDDNGVLVALRNAVTGVGYACRRIFPHGFRQDLIRVKVRKLISYVRYVFFVSDDINIAGVTNREKSLISRLKKRLPGTENIQKLLGFGITAVGPKAATYTSGHEDYVKMFVHYWNSTNRSKTMKIVTNSVGKNSAP